MWFSDDRICWKRSDLVILEKCHCLCPPCRQAHSLLFAHTLLLSFLPALRQFIKKCGSLTDTLDIYLTQWSSKEKPQLLGGMIWRCLKGNLSYWHNNRISKHLFWPQISAVYCHSSDSSRLIDRKCLATASSFIGTANVTVISLFPIDITGLWKALHGVLCAGHIPWLLLPN